SFPRLVEEQPNLPSPLITHLPLYNRIQADLPRNSTALRPWLETYHLPLRSHEVKRAGSHVLAHQAKCPFRAFAMQRLHVKQTPPPSIGPSPLERGLLIHKILEELWRTLKTQDSLCKQSSEALDALITQAIQAAIQPLVTQKPQSFNPLVQSVEFKRLKRLVEATLAWEKTRPPFVVEALEKSFTLTLAGLEFNLQVDRLDRMSSGKKWIIDYKSRLPTPLPWLETRPEAPQLLLYSLMDEAIRGLIFIELKQGQLTTRGLIDEESELTDLRTLESDTSWAAVQAQWVEQLTLLAEEFQQGHCPPLPTHTRTCQTCDVHSLCRRHLSSIKQPTVSQK
ncbi:MAG: PD-(D/E)XK nuclease family protein, partial [Legionellaceae bacterium]